MNDPRLEPGEGPRTRACGQSHCGKESPEHLGASGLAVGVHRLQSRHQGLLATLPGPLGPRNARAGLFFTRRTPEEDNRGAPRDS